MSFLWGQQNFLYQNKVTKWINRKEEQTDSPLTGVVAGPVRFWAPEPPDRVRVNPDTVRPKSLNPLREISAPPAGCWDSVRGLKCLQRHALMFKRIRLRSTGVSDEGRGPAGSEVLVSEVLVLELRSGEVSGSGSGSESALWRTPRSVWARSIRTLEQVTGKSVEERPGSNCMSTPQTQQVSYSRWGQKLF